MHLRVDAENRRLYTYPKRQTYILPCLESWQQAFSSISRQYFNIKIANKYLVRQISNIWEWQ
jgi:hypothetical protein